MCVRSRDGLSCRMDILHFMFANVFALIDLFLHLLYAFLNHISWRAIKKQQTSQVESAYGQTRLLLRHVSFDKVKGILKATTCFERGYTLMTVFQE